MKTFLSILLILCLVGVGECATYYVRTDGHDPNCNGTANVADSTPVRPACAYKTVAKINASTLSPGDYVKFKDDQTWREQIIVPNTGTVGSNITFTRTSDGTNKPIISGADVMSGTWTREYSETGGIFVGDAETNDLTQWTSYTHPSTTSIAASATAKQNGRYGYLVTSDGTNAAYLSQVFTAGADFYVRIYLFLPTGFTLATNATPFNFIELRSGGGGGSIIAKLAIVRIDPDIKLRVVSYYDTGLYIDSGFTTITLNAQHYIELHWKSDAAAGGVGYKVDGSSIFADFTKDTSGNTVDTINVGQIYGSGSYPTNGKTFYFDDVKVDSSAIGAFSSAGVVGCYSTALTTQPYSVVYDSTLGTLTDSVAHVDSANEWYWAANKLYVYSASAAPNVSYTTPGIQAAQRSTCVTVGKSYITVDGLQLETSNAHSYGGNIFVQAASPPKNFTMQNCDSRWSATHGIAINTTGFSTGGGHLIQNNLLHHNILAGFMVVDDNATTPSTIQNNTVYNNQFDGIGVLGNYYTIQNNVVHDNGLLTTLGSGIHINAETNGSGWGTYNTIRYNLIYNQVAHAEDGAAIAIDLYSDHNNVYYNIGYHVDGPGIYVLDSTYTNVYNNTFYDCERNTATDSSNLGTVRINGSTNTVIKNNNVYSNNTNDWAIFADATSVASITVANNNLYRNGTGGHISWWNTAETDAIATFNGYTGCSSNISANPSWISTSVPNFHLLPNSPCRDTGVSVSLTSDFEGRMVPIGSAPDMGCYEASFLNSIFFGM